MGHPTTSRSDWCRGHLESLRDYEAMPFSRDNRLRVRETPDFLASLNGILFQVAEDLHSWVRSKMGADLSQPSQRDTTAR